MSSSELQPSYHVAIIGAGVAGLTAARELLTSQRLSADELVVLEASDRIGGRAFSVPFGSLKSVMIDVGATWIHGASEANPFFRDVIVPAKIEYKAISDRNPWLHPASCNGYQLFDGRETLNDEDTEHAWRISAALLETLQHYATEEELENQYGDKSIQVIVDTILHDADAGNAFNSAFKQLVEGHARGEQLLAFCLVLIESWMGASADTMQLEDFEEIDLIGDDPGAHCLVPYGMAQAVKHLGSFIPDGVVHTNTPVELVEYASSDGVTLHLVGGNRPIHVDRVIVTCSLGALKAEKIKFSPPLPMEKRAVIQRLSMGHYMKVLLEFPRVFWPEQGQFFCNVGTSAGDMGADGVRFPLVFSYYGIKGAPLLEGVLSGKVALDASELEDGAIVDAFIRSLRNMFGDDIPEPVSHFITRWNKNPWTLGAYSYLTLQSSTEDPELLRKTVDGRVLFAGEATTMKYQGSLQGAYVTGLAAVGELDALSSRPSGPK